MIISLKDDMHITVTNSYVVLRRNAMPIGANHRVHGFHFGIPKEPWTRQKQLCNIMKPYLI